LVDQRIEHKNVQWLLVIAIQEDHALAPKIRVLFSSWQIALGFVELSNIENGDLVNDPP